MNIIDLSTFCITLTEFINIFIFFYIDTHFVLQNSSFNVSYLLDKAELIK